jgi:putative FmdB family regulatory protein
MPLYEYTCIKCRKKFELIRSLSERDEKCECPHCRAKGKMDRQSSLVSTAGRSGGDSPAGSCGSAGSPFT